MNWQPAVAARLTDGRLHLHHGPIDLIVEACGEQSEEAYKVAGVLFSEILPNLVTELRRLRTPICSLGQLQGTVASRMRAAVLPFCHEYITPMAAVAGAVADHVITEMVSSCSLSKAYVNNGGDIAIYQTPDTEIVVGCVGGNIRLCAADLVGGIATSGWRGRSHSLGIADAVTVLAGNAAQADAAATMIANHVDLPGHQAINRIPASTLAPDSDLGDRLVTTSVGRLSSTEIDTALSSGLTYAKPLLASEAIFAVLIWLQGEYRILCRDEITAAIQVHPRGTKKNSPLS